MRLLILAIITFATRGMSNNTSTTELLNGRVSTLQEGIYIATDDGNGWYLEDNEFDLQINEEVVITFDNIGTESIYDDEIIKIEA